MTQMKIKIGLSDRIRSKRGSAKACLIATAGRRQWGGDWNVTPRSVERDTGNGQVQQWRPSFGAQIVMMLFDAGLPVPARSVKLVRSRKPTRPGCILSPGKTKTRTPAEPPAARMARTARRVAVGSGAVGALLLAVNGLEWIIYAIAAALAGCAAVVTTRKIRGHRQAGVLPPAPVRPSAGSVATRPHAAKPVLPARAGLELEPVQPPAPKTIREAVPPAREVVNARR